MNKKIFKSFIVALAPMAGVSDFAFRKICADFGADMTTTEMISAKAYEYNSNKTMKMLKELNHSAIKCVQLFGHDLSITKIINSGNLSAFDIIDFNCGCPAPKIVKNKEGSYLMQDIESTRKIIEAIVKSTDKLVSVKFRLGINNNINYLAFAKMCEESGVDFITLHARTREQQYGGTVDKNAYKTLVNSVNIPVIWSGDIKTKADVDYAKSIGCAGVMIGRNALGNPEIFSELKSKKPPYLKKQAIITHLSLLKEHINNDKTTYNYFKKHLAWYLKTIPNSAELKRKAVTVTSLQEMEDIIHSLPEDF